MTKAEKWKALEANLDKIQARFLFAWEHTVYRANLVALRTELGLHGLIKLPVDEAIQLAKHLRTRKHRPPRPPRADGWMEH